MTGDSMSRGRLRRALPLMALAGAALALGGCVDDGYDGYGAYGGGYYGDVYGSYDGVYDGWPSYGWYDGFYYPGAGVYVYDRGGRRHHWNGPGGHGWNGGHGWAGGHGTPGGNGGGQHGWNGRPGGGWHGGGRGSSGGGGHGWHGPSGGTAHAAPPAPAPSRGERPR